MKRWGVMAVLAVLLPMAVMAQPIDVSPNITVLDIRFGVFEAEEGGQEAFIPFSNIPLEVGRKYGWVMLLDTDLSTISWREELDLPRPPVAWGDLEEGGIQISNNGRTAITEREEIPLDGILANTWTVAPGDPPGLYSIRVYIEDELIKTFHFVVE